MDVKRMHEMIEKLSECAKTQFDKGIDHVDITAMLTADLHLKVVEPTAEVMKNHPIIT